MQRTVSSLLILLLLISQNFWAVYAVAGHSHAGTSIVEPEEHSARPHVHLHGDQHHHGHGKDGHEHHEHHSQREQNDPLSETPVIGSEQDPVNHDSNALYVSETQLVNHVRPVRINKPERCIACLIYDESSAIASLCHCIGHKPMPPHRVHKCPLYLQTLSIRC